MSKYLRQRYQAMAAYVPGEQPRDRRYVKLNTNESPFPPSPAVLAAVNAAEAENLRLYSDPKSTVLKEKLARNYGMKEENVFVSNGSDDILNFAFMAFGFGGVAYPAISYGFYPVFAELHGLPALEIPLEADLSIDPAKFQSLSRMVVIANPNAPTGLLLSVDDIRTICQTNPNNVVLIDEAYIDFGGESCLPLICEFDNLLVVRTFSKSRSMAGARLGFAFGHADLIADLEKLKYATNPYDINRLTQAAGSAALDEDDYYWRNCQKIVENRAFAAAELSKRGFTMTASQANFLFAKHPKISGEALYQQLKSKGILVRHFSRPEIADYNRITVGSRADMEALIQAITEILEVEP